MHLKKQQINIELITVCRLVSHSFREFSSFHIMIIYFKIIKVEKRVLGRFLNVTFFIFFPFICQVDFVCYVKNAIIIIIETILI